MIKSARPSRFPIIITITALIFIAASCNRQTTVELAGKKLKADPKQTLVIGDRLDKDIMHANKLGCVSVRLIRHGGRYANFVGTKSTEKPKFTIFSLNEVPKLLI